MMKTIKCDRCGTDTKGRYHPLKIDERDFDICETCHIDFKAWFNSKTPLWRKVIKR